MALPRLENGKQTISGLHQGARLLGAVQQLTQAPQPAYLELALNVDRRGLAAGPLPSGGRVRLDIPSCCVVYEVPGEASASFPLSGASQAQVFADLFTRLGNREPSGLLPQGADLFERVAQAIAQRPGPLGEPGRYKPPRREQLLDESTIAVDPRASEDFLQALAAIDTGIARFKARLRGMQTPLVVWPHGFDLSTLWFAGTEIDEQQLHMNFGFSPGSAGIEYPYLYAYAYPYPEGSPPAALPEGAHWHSEGWNGVVLPYPVIAARPDPVEFVEMACASMFTALASRLEGLRFRPYF